MRLKVSEGCFRTFSQIILSAYNCSSVLPSWPTFSSSCWCPFLKSIPCLAWLTESKATRLLYLLVEDVAFISVGNDHCYYIWLTVAACPIVLCSYFASCPRCQCPERCFLFFMWWCHSHHMICQGVDLAGLSKKASWHIADKCYRKIAHLQLSLHIIPPCLYPLAGVTCSMITLLI